MLISLYATLDCFASRRGAMNLTSICPVRLERSDSLANIFRPFSYHQPREIWVLAMSNEQLRTQLVKELQRTIGEVVRLSEMITVLRASHMLETEKLAELSTEWAAANNRAAELRREIQNVEDADDD